MGERLVLLPVYILVFATGSAGLVYQVAWQKYLSRLLGSDSMATAVILGTFLGGLSIGFFICGRLTAKVNRHFRAYALLEGAIGIYGLMFPTIFRLVESISSTWSFTYPVNFTVQGVLCSVLLIGIPTACMGGTIPFLTRGLSRSLAEATNIHAEVYAINTAGAFLGVLVAGFYLVPELGLPLTVMGAALLNLSAFIFFFFLSDKNCDASGAPMAEKLRDCSATQLSTYKPRGLYLIAFLSGCYVMTLENIFIRLTNLSLGSSSYSFSIIVAVFILSIAVGSHLVGKQGKIPREMLFLNQLGITILLIFVYLTLDTWPYWAHLIRISFQSNEAGFWGYYLAVFLVLCGLLLVPVGLMGATVPLTFHELKRRLDNVGVDSGSLFSWNTAGNLCGSLVGGILLYHWFNLGTIFLIAVLLAALSTLMLSFSLSRRKVAAAGACSLLVCLLVVFTPFYNEKRFAMGTFRQTKETQFSYSGPETFFREFMFKYSKILFYKDDPVATVAVTDSLGKSGDSVITRAVYLNGKSDSSANGRDVATLKLLAHLPALLAAEKKNILLIGLGTGVTAGELTLYPDTERIDIAEISPSVVNALPLFAEFTNKLDTNPKAKFQAADAFRVLSRSNKKWNLIISEPSNPWVTGVDLLFTREFYAKVKDRLSDNGMLLQWVHTYSFNPALLGMVVNTLRQEFPHARAFMATKGDLLILCPKQPVTMANIRRAAAIMANGGAVADSLRAIHLDRIENLLLREIWTPSYLKDNFAEFGEQNMDNPRLHYLAGKAFFMGNSVDPEFLFNFRTKQYADEYLLTAWGKEQGDSLLFKGDLGRMLESCRDSDMGYFPTYRQLKIRAWQSDPSRYPLSMAEQQEYKIDNLQEIAGRVEVSQTAPVDNKALRAKVDLLAEYLFSTGSWLLPVPVEGLKRVIGKGIATADDDRDRNMYRLQLARLNLLENGTEQQAVAAVQGLSRDKGGNIELHTKDLPLLIELRRLVKSRYK